MKESYYVGSIQRFPFSETRLLALKNREGPEKTFLSVFRCQLLAFHRCRT